jgi:F-type H+-transporting ATPase subunit gamma
MAGAYNLNILKKVIGEIKSDDGVIVFGEKGFKFLNKNLKPEQILKYFNLSEKPEDFIYMKYIAKYVYNLYRQGKFSSVKAVYTKFKNMSYFLPINLTIFPLDFNAFTNFNTQKQQIPCFLIEPNPLSAYRHIVNLYVETILYSLFLESKLCEHLSRKSAMIEASDNEDKKINDLNIAYNKKRQEKITSEVSLLAMTL